MANKLRTIFIVSQSFTENKGSFSGFIEKFAKFASNQNFKIIILCLRLKKQKTHEKKSYAEVYRFSHIKMPFFSQIFNAFFLAKSVKSFFKKIPPSDKDIFIANGEAALGVLKYPFIHRGGDQPAYTFLKNMEIAKKEVSIITRIARLMHLTFQYFLEMKFMKHSIGLIYSSKEARNNFVHYYGGKTKPYFTPHAGVDFFDLKNAKKVNLPGRNMLFISAGEEKIRKGIIYVERALPILFDKYPEVNLIHVGSKFEWNVPKKYKKRIVSVGRVPWNNMKNYYNSSDFLIVASLNEAMPGREAALCLAWVIHSLRAEPLAWRVLFFNSRRTVLGAWSTSEIFTNVSELN